MSVKKYSTEVVVGVFVLIGLLCVTYLTVRLGKMDFFTNDGYTIVAKFSSTTGLKNGAEVEIAGVSVGKVTKIELDDAFYSTVSMRINDGVNLAADTGAAIKTSGLIGDKYINLTPGGAEADLKPGAIITNTQAPVDIESLISKYVFGSVKPE